jgi:hypothetical protein
MTSPKMDDRLTREQIEYFREHDGDIPYLEGMSNSVFRRKLANYALDALRQDSSGGEWPNQDEAWIAGYRAGHQACLVAGKALEGPQESRSEVLEAPASSYCTNEEALESTVNALHEQVAYLKEALEQYAIVDGAKGQIARTALKLYALPLDKQRREMSRAALAAPAEPMGKTPRTDANLIPPEVTWMEGIVTAEFARKLERENNELRRQVAALQK